MYDHAPLSVVHYLLNGDNLRSSFNIRRGLHSRLHNDNDHELETLGTWDKVGVFGREKVVAAYLDPQVKDTTADADYDLASMQRNFARNVLEMVDSAPAVDFIVVLPPISILAWKFMATRRPMMYESLLHLAAHIREELVKRPNVRPFDFQDLRAITFDLDNYMDLRHYSGAVSRYIVEAIVEDRHPVPPGDPAGSVVRIRQQVVEYNAPSRSAVRSDP